MLILTHTEVTNAMPTVYTILEYDYKRKKKGTDQVWYSRDIVCEIESHKATKIALITVNAQRAIGNSHIHMCRTCLNHIASQRNSGR